MATDLHRRSQISQEVAACSISSRGGWVSRSASSCCSWCCCPT